MRLPEVSVEATLQAEMAELGHWLAAQGLDLGSDKAHMHEGSRDRLYWRYGYFAGLKQALMLLAERAAATLH
jgi:hypothetical protein